MVANYTQFYSNIVINNIIRTKNNTGFSVRQNKSGLGDTQLIFNSLGSCDDFCLFGFEIQIDS